MPERGSGGVPAASTALEQHYSPGEVARLYGISRQKVMREFGRMPGVVYLDAPQLMRRKKGSAARRLLRIPESIVRRWHEARVVVERGAKDK